MRTIRLLYPDYVSGGNIEEYYFGANLLAHILPVNESQPVYRVAAAAPDGGQRGTTGGIYAREEVLAGIRSADTTLQEVQPDRVVTIGGTCLVSLAPFDYLHGRYRKAGIVWIDAHPDVSEPADGYPNAHAMVLGTLLGGGDPAMRAMVRNGFFSPDSILYIGLQGLHDYQEDFLRRSGVPFKVQTGSFVADDEIRSFLARFAHVLVHLDIDVLDPEQFHSTYFANKSLVGDGSGGGRMTMEELTSVLDLIAAHADMAGLTIAEYLPFDAFRLHRMLDRLPILTGR